MKKILKLYFRSIEYIGYRGIISPSNVVLGIIFSWFFVPAFLLGLISKYIYKVLTFPFKKLSYLIADYLNK